MTPAEPFPDVLAVTAPVADLLAAVDRVYAAGLAELREVTAPGPVADARRRVLAAEAALRALVRDRAARLRAQNRLAELRLRQERALGRWLSDHVDHSGGGDRRSVSRGRTPVRDLPAGVSRNDSHRFQKLAAVPDSLFDRFVSDARDAGREITTAAALKLARPPADAKAGQSAADPGCTVADLADLVDRGLTFGAVYADPPWPYQNAGTRGAAAGHYRTMSLGDLAALPVARLAAADAHLHLWATTSFLAEALALIAAWGFAYKSHFVWAKPSVGLGNYWRVSHELLLLGVRGRCPFRVKGERSWQCHPRGRHSEKPEAVRAAVERVSPGPYLELFGRRPAPGWAVWGDEIAYGLFDRDVRRLAGSAPAVGQGPAGSGD